MAFDPQEVQAAVAKQTAAAQDVTQRVRLVAGPGSGKSSSIRERVRWLLANGIPPESLHVISFTNASVRDLADAIRPYCEKHDQDATGVRISTLHAVALRLLQVGNLLAQYPVEPTILDRWESTHLIDKEFAQAQDCTPGRAQAVRRKFEAMANTGHATPANFAAPDPAVTDAESQAFAGFLTQRKALYACVLPGEMVRECVVNIEAGLLEPKTLLGVSQLIVDEFQDLNPVDLKFVDQLMAAEVVTFVAGDDDQSVYSFRFASPAGIQDFLADHPGTADHALDACWRSTPAVLHAALSVIEHYAAPGRIPKSHYSLYADAQPTVPGVVHRWRFKSAKAEADALAETCRALTEPPDGMAAKDIFVLMSNQRLQAGLLYEAFEQAGVPFVPARDEGFLDTDEGRLAVALLRIVSRPDDLVAHRVAFGLMRGVGIGTCLNIVHGALTGHVSGYDLFHAHLPVGVFSARVHRLLRDFAEAIQPLEGWAPTDTLSERSGALGDLMVRLTGDPGVREAWDAEVADVPPEATLMQVRGIVTSGNIDQRAKALAAVLSSLGQDVPVEELSPDAVRFMSIHGSKGLSARVVLIPGLEEGILPGMQQQEAAGLVFEAARMLYVAITRARAACVLSLASSRMIFGAFNTPSPSRFATHTGGSFAYREGGLTQEEAGMIRQTGALL